MPDSIFYDDNGRGFDLDDRLRVVESGAVVGSAALRDAPGNLGAAFTWAVAGRSAVDLIATVDQITAVTITGLVVGGRYRLYLTLGAGGPFACSITDGSGSPVALALGALPGDISVFYLDVPTTGLPIVLSLGVGASPPGPVITVPAATVAVSAPAPTLILPRVITAPPMIASYSVPAPTLSGAGSVTMFSVPAVVTFSIAPPTIVIPFDPLTLSPLIWQDPSSRGLSDGASISTDANLGTTGTADDFHQSTPSFLPTFKTNQLNGQSVDRFDGNDGLNDDGASAMAFTLKPFTIVAVIKPTNFAIPRGIYAQPPGVTSGIALYLAATTGVATLDKNGILNIAAASAGVTAGVASVLVVTYSSGGVYSFYINGTLAGTGTNNQTFTGTGKPILSDANNTIGISWLGDMGARGIFNTVLSSTDRNNLTHALGAKYGITVV